MKHTFRSLNPYLKNNYLKRVENSYVRSGSKNNERYLIVDNFIKKNKIKSVLDCGCTSGDLLIKLRKNKKLKLFGCDTHRLFNQKKLKKLKINVFIDDVTKLKTKRKFDLILCFGVIQFLKDPIKTINKLYKNLNKNGFLIVASQNPFFSFVTFNSISKKFLGTLNELSKKKFNKISKNFLISHDGLTELNYKTSFNHIEIFNPFSLKNLFSKKIKYVTSLYYGYHNNPLKNNKSGRKYKYKKTFLHPHQVWKKYFFSSGVLSVFKR